MPQGAQLRLNVRRYLIDVIMQTPQRFSEAFRAAVEAEFAGIRTCHRAGPVSASGWLLIGNHFLTNDLHANVTKTTLLSRPVCGHVG